MDVRGVAPGIVHLMPGDNGAGEHTEAHSWLCLRVNRSQLQIHVHKKYISFFCNSISSSHFFSSGGGRNKSKSIWGFSPASSSVVSQVQGNRGNTKGHLLWFCGYRVILLRVGSSVVCLCQWVSFFQALRFLHVSPSSAPSMWFAGTRGHPGPHMPCWWWGTGHLYQACLAMSSTRSWGSAWGSGPAPLCSQILQIYKVFLHRPLSLGLFGRIQIIFLQTRKIYIHLALLTFWNLYPCVFIHA